MKNISIDKFRHKNIGKYIIIGFIILLGVISLYKGREVFTGTDYESGIVLGKNETMTSGKYPKQQFIVAFKFDNPEYGTQDIVTTFYCWNSLKVGQRTAFHPSRNKQFIEAIWVMLATLYAIVIIGVLAILIYSGIYYIWNL